MAYQYHRNYNHNHKKSFFFRSVNAIFGKVDRIATDEVILQLVFFSKCIPVLLYGLESVSLTLSDVRSLRLYLQPFHDKVI